ncbi:uncharacterized protein [Amphiura filiformis]|uniref:uncharacterized protein n=1 Tax=Amphiura filiformis TaxID=82378 RepID=UPI003B217B9C
MAEVKDTKLIPVSKVNTNSETEGKNQPHQNQRFENAVDSDQSQPLEGHSIVGSKPPASPQSCHGPLEHIESGSSGYSSTHVVSLEQLQNLSSQEELKKFLSPQDESSQHGNPELQGYLLVFNDWVQTHVDNPNASLAYMSQTGTFAAAIFDKSGGYLNLPRYNTSLFVPPGALRRNQIQKLYIFVEIKSPLAACPVEGAQWQSYIVHCGPPGTQFQSDIVLSFPHGLSEQPSDNMGACLSSSDGEEWANLDSPNEGLVASHEKLVTIMIDHFTRFASYSFMYDVFRDGDPLSLTVGVLMRRVPSAVQLHVILWNARKEEQVVNEEALLDARLCDRTRAFRVKNPEKDVTIYLGLSNNVGHVVKYSKVINIGAILDELRGSRYTSPSPSVTFAALTDLNPPDLFTSTVLVTQQEDGDCSGVDAVEFLVLPPSSRVPSSNLASAGNCQIRPAHIRRAQFADVRKDSPNTSFRISQSDLTPPAGAFTECALTVEEFTHLAEVISREDPRGTGDWRSFADFLGLRPYYQVKERADHQCRSPGTLVLTYFLARTGARLGRLGTLQKLLDVMQRCRIEHAASLLKEWLHLKDPYDVCERDQAEGIDNSPKSPNIAVSESPYCFESDSEMDIAKVHLATNNHVNMVNKSGSCEADNNDPIEANQHRCSPNLPSSLSDHGLGTSIDALSPDSSRNNSIGSKGSWTIIQSLSLNN